MVRLLHTADWQLGMGRRYLDADAQARFSEARVDVIARIAEVSREEDCALVVVAGDVFEDNHVQRRAVWRALEAMGTVPAPVYLLPGNHDPLDAGSLYRSGDFASRCPDNVVVIEGTDPLEVVPGVEIVGAPWMSKRPLDDLCRAAVEGLEPAAGTVRVLVGHGIVDRLSPDPDNPARIRLDALERALAEQRVHYAALGDRHSTTRVGESGRVWYSGAPEPTDFDEVDPGNVLVVDVDEGHCEVTPRRVGRWRFAEERFEFSGDGDVPAVRAWLDELTDPQRVVVRLQLVGALSLRGRAEVDEVLEQAAETLASVRVREHGSDLAVVADEADVRELELRGFARDAAAALSEQATAHPDDTAASDALRLLHRLARPQP